MPTKANILVSCSVLAPPLNNGPPTIFKWKTAALTAGAARAPASLTGMFYNQRAVSTLTYKAMFLEIPRTFGRQELSVVHSMLKVPNNSFTRGTIFRMNDMGGPALISAQITCIASAMRAALTTLDGWERWMSELKTAALDYGYMGRWLRGEWWPTCWSSIPIAKSTSMETSFARLRMARHGLFLQRNRMDGFERPIPFASLNK